MNLPSIRRRLARALLLWALLSGLLLASAVWLAARHEVDELLDDTLHASAELIGGLLQHESFAELERRNAQLPGAANAERFAWQVLGAEGQVLLRSSGAPEDALRSSPSAGFSNVANWRLYGLALGREGRMLYVAQTRSERLEVQAEITLSAILAALAVGLMGQLWVRFKLRHELAPLQALSERLAAFEPADARASLGPAEREELRPVHAAIDELSCRLADRVANERAFAGHASHALRTPLAGIDAQLAVALLEAPAELRPRLQRAREAAQRLQHVVAALLGLFRSNTELQRRPIDVAELLARLPVQGLTVSVQEPAVLNADPDLLAAALLNLLDNARRYGATAVTVDVPAAGLLRLHDNGPGLAAERVTELQAALDAHNFDANTGLGLMLAERVASAHGGALRLVPAEQGFCIELALGGPAAEPQRKPPSRASLG
jgi:signal transduction histidine kinase